MKKILNILLVIATLIIGVFALAGCEKDNEKDLTNTNTETKNVMEDNSVSGLKTTELETVNLSESNSQSIVGSWKNDELGYDFIYTFNEDGTGKYDAAGTIMEFTYSTNENELSILYTGNTAPFQTTYHIDGATLNVVDSIGNDTLYQKVN